MKNQIINEITQQIKQFGIRKITNSVKSMNLLTKASFQQNHIIHQEASLLQAKTCRPSKARPLINYCLAY